MPLPLYCLFVSFLALCVIAPTGQALATISITDDAGRAVTMVQPARRIVLTDGMGLTGLAAIDDEPVARLAGWNRARLDAEALDAFRKALPAIDSIPDIGELRSGPAAVEAIIAIAPDLVVLDPYYNRSAAAIRQMERAGIAVAILALTPSLRDPEPAYGVKRLAVLIGREAQGKAFSEFFGERLERIRSRVENVPVTQRPVVLLEAHAGRGACCMVAGAGQGIGDFVSFAGGHNLGADRVPGMAGQISPEYAVAAQPEVYIGTGGAYMAGLGGLTVGPSISAADVRRSLDSVVQRTGLAGSPAVAEGRAYALWHGLAISGINIVAVETMAKWIHPDIFSDIDPQATLDVLNENFLAVPLTGVMWAGIGDVGKGPGDEP